MQNHILRHNPRSSFTMTFDNVLWIRKVVFTAIAFSRIRPWCYYKLKPNSSDKTTYCQSACQSLCSWTHCSHRRSRWSCEILYQNKSCKSTRQQTLTNWRCKQWYTCVSWSMCCQMSGWNCTVRQHHADHLSIMLFDITIQGPLSDLWVGRCSSVHQLQTCIALYCCYAAHELLLHDREIHSYEDQWCFSPIQTLQLLKCRPLKS